MTTPILRREIDLDANPTLPLTSAIVKKRVGGGRVVIEKFANGVCLNGKKLILHRTSSQISRKTIRGYELYREVENLTVPNATAFDFFVANPAFVPEDWKADEDGNIIRVVFWGTLFMDGPGGSVCVRCGRWNGVRLVPSYFWLFDNIYVTPFPAVVFES